jgi:serine/threonine protein kinase
MKTFSLWSITLKPSIHVFPSLAAEAFSVADLGGGVLVYLITDLCLGGELFDRICRKGNYYESDAANLVRTTVSAVSYLHDHGIVHRGNHPPRLFLV